MPPRGLSFHTPSRCRALPAHTPHPLSEPQTPLPPDSQGAQRKPQTPPDPPSSCHAGPHFLRCPRRLFCPTFLRFVVLALAAILTLGSRTICNLLRTVGALAPGHPSSYHRVFCTRAWSSWRLAHGLTGWVLDSPLPQGLLLLAGDGTVDDHPGAKVFGRRCLRHQDPAMPEVPDLIDSLAFTVTFEHNITNIALARKKITRSRFAASLWRALGLSTWSMLKRGEWDQPRKDPGRGRGD
jgi:hypothetical protein